MGARGGKPCPKPRRPQRRTRKGEERVDALAVWVTYQLVGATQCAERHDVARRTVYRCVDEVEGDPARLDAARKALAAQRADATARQSEVTDAAREALLAKIRGGRVPSRVLARLVLAGAPAQAPGGGPSAMQVPAFFTKPRTEGPA